MIALDQGNVAAAQANIASARDSAVQSGDTMTLANADLTLGQIKVEQGDCSGASGLFAAAEREYARGEMETGEAVATSFAALCGSAMGNAHARDAALARAIVLRSRITERQEVIQADINLAELRGTSGERNVAIAALQALEVDARGRDWPGWAMECELAEIRVFQRSGDTRRANAIRARVVDEAKQKGFNWIVQRAETG